MARGDPRARWTTLASLSSWMKPLIRTTPSTTNVCGHALVSTSMTFRPVFTALPAVHVFTYHRAVRGSSSLPIARASPDDTNCTDVTDLDMPSAGPPSAPSSSTPLASRWLLTSLHRERVMHALYIGRLIDGPLPESVTEVQQRVAARPRLRKLGQSSIASRRCPLGRRRCRSARCVGGFEGGPAVAERGVVRRGDS